MGWAFLALGAGLGLGLGGWANVPAAAHQDHNALTLVIALTGIAGYLAGRARNRRGTSAVAIATAVAKAQARATSTATASNRVMVVNLPAGATLAADGHHDLDDMPWLDHRQDRTAAADHAMLEEAAEHDVDDDPADLLWPASGARASEAARPRTGHEQD